MVPFLNRRAAALAVAGCALAAGACVYLKLRHDLRQELARADRDEAALDLAPVVARGFQAPRWGSAEVAAAAVADGDLLVAGGFGLADRTGDAAPALPTLRACALTLWRGRPVAALEAGGVFVREDGVWKELRTGFGDLHARALAETAGGELLIGAQEGLFRAAWGARALKRLDRAPVRCLALGEGGLLLAGGEQGLRRFGPGGATLLATPDPWIDWVGCAGAEVAVVTPLGLARGPLGGALAPLPGGEEAQSAAWAGANLLAAGRGRVLRFGAASRAVEEPLPAQARKLITAGGEVLADTGAGLFRRGPQGWTRVRPPVEGQLPPDSAHLSALAWLGPRLVAGLFNGGLAQAEPQGEGFAWAAVPGSQAWGVNALLPAGGALEVASLRGLARFDGRILKGPGGDGAAFALATTPEGLAVGYGQGVQMPGPRLLSAFHGLPGNQALALAAAEDVLFVGTPSGLGAVAGGKVLWRVTAGEGRLPHPWITALALHGGALYVGTYGGGVACRRTPPDQARALGAFAAYPETAALKVNTGCLVAAGGRLWLGTDGRGLWRLRRDGSRFEPVPARLPSPRVTALLEAKDALLVGTDQGLARIPLHLPEEGS